MLDSPELAAKVEPTSEAEVDARRDFVRSISSQSF